MFKSIDEVYSQSVQNAKDLEPWEGYYLTRKTMLEVLASRFNFNKDSVGLEIGCGTAFQSILLAKFSKTIFATDLFYENKETHSLGMNIANQLIHRLEIDNLKLISSSGALLPFKGNDFDFVFSSSVLEHVEDKPGALKEMYRVLKSGGRLILILPTHMPSIYAFPHMLLYVIGWGIKRLNNRHKDSTALSRGTEKAAAKRFLDNHPSFPLPEPHGAYKNIFSEMIRQFPGRWRDLIKRAGFDIVDTFPTCILPWLLIEPFSTGFAARIYARTEGLHKKIARKKFLINIAYLAAFVAVKKKA